MDFPVSIPWETLDPEILQKAINSGSNYRTYCDEKSWDISFEIEFLEKEEIIFLLLVEHGRRKGGTSVQKTNERTEISKYTKEEHTKDCAAVPLEFELQRKVIIMIWCFPAGGKPAMTL